MSAALGSLLDAILDLTVLPGYTRVGYRLRRRLLWPSEPPSAMTGRTALVTGATSGIGRACACALAGLGATVHMLVRDRERGERAAAQIAAVTGREVRIELADISSIASVRSFARGFAAEHESLSILVNNAGVLSPQRQLTAESHELTFATSVLGMFVLTNELLPLLAAGAPSRVINVSSGGMYTARVDVGDLESARGAYDGTAAYARAKRAQVILTEMWARRLAGSGVVVHSMHPGWADTPGLARSLPRFRRVTRPLLRTPAEGADTIVWLASAAEPARSSGGFWHDRRRRPTRRLPCTLEAERDREQLWAACMRATGPYQPEVDQLLQSR